MTQGHNIANRILFNDGGMEVGNTDRLALQNLQIPGRSTNRTPFDHTHDSSDKQRLTSSLLPLYQDKCKWQGESKKPSA
eukprot:139502-Pelagomonas_calceolata.AAC.3